MENKIDGAVLVLVDVDAVKRSEERHPGRARLCAEPPETVRESLLVIATAADTLGRFIYEINEGRWNLPRMRLLLAFSYSVSHDLRASIRVMLGRMAASSAKRAGDMQPTSSVRPIVLTA